MGPGGSLVVPPHTLLLFCRCLPLPLCGHLYVLKDGEVRAESLMERFLPASSVLTSGELGGQERLKGREGQWEWAGEGVWSLQD